jgi:hypothetical protein
MNRRRFQMKTTRGLGALAMMALCTSCTPPVEKAPKPKASTPAPTPPATPHPAQGATEAAIRLYPDLGKKGSTFHRAFLERYEHLKSTNPRSLVAVDWPLNVAHRTAAMLRVEPYSPPVATPVPVVTTPAYYPPSSLSRGAYDSKREVAKPPRRVWVQ